MKKFKKIVSTMFIAMLILSMTLLAGCKKKNDSSDGSANSKKLALTVEDQKVYLDEMMYYIFMNEYQLNQYEQMYQMYMGSSYWDSEYEKGVTMREFAKTSTMDMVTQYEIMYAEALKAGYKLTEEEKTSAKANVDQFMQIITKEQLELTGLNEKLITKIVEKLTLTSRYMQDLVDGFAIDDEAIKATFKKEDYRQYDTQALFVTTSKIDEEGKTQKLSDKDKSAAKKKLEAVLAKAKAGDDFAKIVENNKDVVNQDKSFVVGKGIVSEEYEKAATPLKNDEVTDIIEMEDGFYIIKMVNNNSDESYNTEVNGAIQAEEEKQFNAEYEKIKKNYKVTVNNEVWDEIVMGKTTLIPEEKADATTDAAGETKTEESTTEDTKTEDAK